MKKKVGGESKEEVRVRWERGERKRARGRYNTVGSSTRYVQLI